MHCKSYTTATTFAVRSNRFRDQMLTSNFNREYRNVVNFNILLVHVRAGMS